LYRKNHPWCAAYLVVALCLSVLTVSPQSARAQSPAASDANALLQQLKDPNPGVRQSAATALGKLKLAANSSVPQLIEALSDTTPAVRDAAIQALGNLGAVATPAVSQIRD
jgi:HEAT repeat protein